MRATHGAMPDKPKPPSKEDRLAAALRENLRRRKAQARAREARPESPPPEPPPPEPAAKA